MAKVSTSGVIFLCLVAGALPCLARKKDAAPPEPLPQAVVDARKAFFQDSGESKLAVDEFLSQMKKWGRFQLVGSAPEAEIILELRYTKETNDEGFSYDPELSLNIYDAATKYLLWTDEDDRRKALRIKNREKEVTNSADRLADDLRMHVDLGQ